MVSKFLANTNLRFAYLIAKKKKLNCLLFTIQKWGRGSPLHWTCENGSKPRPNYSCYFRIWNLLFTDASIWLILGCFAKMIGWRLLAVLAAKLSSIKYWLCFSMTQCDKVHVCKSTKPYTKMWPVTGFFFFWVTHTKTKAECWLWLSSRKPAV